MKRFKVDIYIPEVIVEAESKDDVELKVESSQLIIDGHEAYHIEPIDEHVEEVNTDG